MLGCRNNSARKPEIVLPPTTYYIYNCPTLSLDYIFRLGGHSLIRQKEDTLISETEIQCSYFSLYNHSLRSLNHHKYGAVLGTSTQIG